MMIHFSDLFYKLLGDDSVFDSFTAFIVKDFLKNIFIKNVKKYSPMISQGAFFRLYYPFFIYKMNQEKNYSGGLNAVCTSSSSYHIFVP